MKNQALFSMKGNSEKLKCHLLQFLFGALRVKILLKLFVVIDTSWNNHSSCTGFDLNGALLHIAFHYHPVIVSV